MFSRIIPSSEKTEVLICLLTHKFGHFSLLNQRPSSLCHYSTHWWRFSPMPKIHRKTHRNYIICQTQRHQSPEPALIVTITCISWILLNPSFQKNSIKLVRVLGPGISFRVLILVSSTTSGGVIDLSSEIPRISLAADLWKLRKAKQSCLFNELPAKFFKHAAVKWFIIAIMKKNNRRLNLLQSLKTSVSAGRAYVLWSFWRIF